MKSNIGISSQTKRKYGMPETLDNDDDATPNGGVGGRCGSRGNASRSPDGCVSLPSFGERGEV